MVELERRGYLEAIKEFSLKERPLLGICLGMQLLFSSSEENVHTKGLNLISGKVLKLPRKNNDGTKNKIPHIGFNEVSFTNKSILGRWSKSPKDFYFVHSYCLSECNDNFEGIRGITEYGAKFISSYEKDLIYATQFHPEKSQTNGLYLINSFLSL